MYKYEDFSEELNKMGINNFLEKLKESNWGWKELKIIEGSEFVTCPSDLNLKQSGKYCSNSIKTDCKSCWIEATKDFFIKQLPKDKDEDFKDYILRIGEENCLKKLIEGDWGYSSKCVFPSCPSTLNFLTEHDTNCTATTCEECWKESLRIFFKNNKQ